jgi:hypothetical protein
MSTRFMSSIDLLLVCYVLLSSISFHEFLHSFLWITNILPLLFVFFGAILYAFQNMLFDYQGEQIQNLTAEQRNHLFLPETTSETHSYCCMKTKSRVLVDKQGNAFCLLV